ncbi:MAG: epoxide hydrolase [Gammaproteobacteria bacterium]|nr:epoxide hydrolase [Gammaproteobacteria bacterium]RPG26805.1 MAG: epoxide hydrolase [Gammaproteobacteria bacterium TMED50]
MESFSISIPQADLDDLAHRLAHVRWPDPETTDDWSQGIPLAYMQEIHAYWRDHHDWRQCEQLLNQWPGYITTIDELPIHFLHIKSRHPDARPLVMTHGWPGSVLEFRKVIEPLTNPETSGGSATDAFHLILPTLPGFGFSGKPTSPGWNIERIAAAWQTLMSELGYTRYLAQGGDWGSMVTTALAQHDGCAGIHINMPVVTPDMNQMNDLTGLEQSALAAFQFYQNEDSGYSKQQGTRPQTLGYGLSDSPIGQAGWILEKFYQWTDCDGDPRNIVTVDELLDNVMMYWLTNTSASSARIYWESLNQANNDPVTVPSGISMFPKEIFKTSERWARTRYQELVYFNEQPKGGHFAAFEQPDAFVEEIRACFALMTL